MSGDTPTGKRLARLRERAGLTQAQVAHELGITQSRVSKVERAEDLNVSTLERYVAALGGELRVGARIGDETIELSPPRAKAPAHGNRTTEDLRRELRELTPEQRFARQLQMSRTALRLRDAGRAARR